jgi:hypothetical protein
MLYGTYLGLFGVFTFLMFPLGMHNPFFLLLFIGLSIASLFVAYYLTRTYRDRVSGGTISFAQGWWFTIVMYMYASILLGLAYYVYFRFLDHGALVAFMQGQYDLLEANGSEVLESQLAQTKEAIDLMASMTPIDIAFSRCAGNMMLGFFVGIVIALFVRRTKPQPTI